MASRYAIEGSVAVIGDSTLAVIGSATVRASVYYITVSSEASPADVTVTWLVKRFTADGTGTGVTPEPLDVQDRAAVSTAKQTYTAEPTYAGVPYLNIGQNQRSVFQWYAQEGGELYSALAAGDGIGHQIVNFSSGTPTISCVMHYKE